MAKEKDLEVRSPTPYDAAAKVCNLEVANLHIIKRKA